jgi:hypothetical protein
MDEDINNPAIARLLVMAPFMFYWYILGRQRSKKWDNLGCVDGFNKGLHAFVLSSLIFLQMDPLFPKKEDEDTRHV